MNPRTEYLQAKRLAGLSPRSLEEYDAKTKRFTDWLFADGIRLELVNAKVVRRYLQTLIDYAPATQATHVAILKNFLGWLAQNDYIDSDPSERIPNPKVPKPIPFILSENDLKSLLRAAGKKPRDYAIIALLLETGLRASEICSVRLGDLSLETRSLIVMGKGGKARTVFFSDFSASALRSWLQVRPDRGEYLFNSIRGDKLNKDSLCKVVKRLGNRAGIIGKRVTPHTLRHCFATLFVKNGGDPHSLQALLGHADTRMSERYVNLVSADVQEKYNRCLPLASVV